MRSSTSSEGSRLVRIVVPCAQTRLPGPRAHSRAQVSGAKRRAFQQACSAGREARSDLCHSLVVDSTFEQRENVAITR